MTLPTRHATNILREAWRRESTATPSLRAEFVTVADYVANRTAEARGAVRVLNSGGYTGPSPYLEVRSQARVEWMADWQTNTQLQVQFQTPEAYADHMAGFMVRQG